MYSELAIDGETAAWMRRNARKKWRWQWQWQRRANERTSEPARADIHTHTHSHTRVFHNTTNWRQYSCEIYILNEINVMDCKEVHRANTLKYARAHTHTSFVTISWKRQLPHDISAHSASISFFHSYSLFRVSRRVRSMFTLAFNVQP